MPPPLIPPTTQPPTTQPPTAQGVTTQGVTTQGGPTFPTGSYGYPPTEQHAAPPAAPPVPPVDVPTQAFAFDPHATQAFPFDPALYGATEVLGAQPVGLPGLRDETQRPSTTSAIDALFGESQFQEYDASALPVQGISALAETRPREPREPMGRPQKILLWVAGGLLAALALIGVFALGTKLDTIFPAAPAEVAPPKPTAVADAKPPAVGPVAVGNHAWNELLGTECIDPFPSAWEESYAVVDCAAPHAAQLVAHGYFGDEAYAPYPGLEALQSRINVVCTSQTAVDYPAASQFSDIQVSASYAATAEQWDAGERDYYCFVSRSSGEPLTASVAHAVEPSDALVPTIPGNDP